MIPCVPLTYNFCAPTYCPLRDYNEELGPGSPSYLGSREGKKESELSLQGGLEPCLSDSRFPAFFRSSWVRTQCEDGKSVVRM